MLSAFVNALDADSIHVYSPKSAIFLCGGRMTDIGEPTPVSMRDAFYKVGDMPFLRDGTDLLRAEDIADFHSKESKYQDFLEFESDLAQLCDLVILFSESPGSFAELGAFARDQEISSKLFAVIRSIHYEQGSFITLGPLASLRHKDPNSVFVVNDNEFGISGTDYSGIDGNLLVDRLARPISDRLNVAREHTTFDPTRSGHLCKLIAALVQEFGALTDEELLAAFDALHFDVNSERLAKLLLCLRSVDWVTEDRRGLRNFIYPNGGREAAKISLLGDEFPKNKDRRRNSIREHWKTSDRERFFALSEKAKYL